MNRNTLILIAVVGALLVIIGVALMLNGNSSNQPTVPASNSQVGTALPAAYAPNQEEEDSGVILIPQHLVETSAATSTKLPLWHVPLVH